MGSAMEAVMKVQVQVTLPVLLLHNQAVMKQGNCHHKVNIYNL